MLRTPKERAELIEAWKRNHPGRAIPVDILPPGLGAPARAPAKAVRKLHAIVDHQQRELRGMSERDLRSLLPVFEKARRELQAQLAHWIAIAPDGELRWTAQHYRQALAQIDGCAKATAEALYGKLDAGTLAAQRMALANLMENTARFSTVFGGVPARLALNEARLIASARSFVIPTIESSARRYQGAVRRDIQERLATDILKGAPVRETIQRLQEHGGPRGIISLREVAGVEGGTWSRAPGAVLEEITEGLFARHRYFAERIVRTEYSAAYGRQALDGLGEAAEQVPGLMKIWIVGAGCCVHICAGLDGVVVPVGSSFETPVGPCDANPAHPNCRCTVSGWCPRWGEPPKLQS